MCTTTQEETVSESDEGMRGEELMMDPECPPRTRMRRCAPMLAIAGVGGHLPRRHHRPSSSPSASSSSSASLLSPSSSSSHHGHIRPRRHLLHHCRVARYLGADGISVGCEYISYDEIAVFLEPFAVLNFEAFGFEVLPPRLALPRIA